MSKITKSKMFKTISIFVAVSMFWSGVVYAAGGDVRACLAPVSAFNGMGEIIQPRADQGQISGDIPESWLEQDYNKFEIATKKEFRNAKFIAPILFRMIAEGLRKDFKPNAEQLTALIKQHLESFLEYSIFTEKIDLGKLRYDSEEGEFLLPVKLDGGREGVVKFSRIDDEERDNTNPDSPPKNLIPIRDGFVKLEFVAKEASKEVEEIKDAFDFAVKLGIEEVKAEKKPAGKGFAPVAGLGEQSKIKTKFHDGTMKLFGGRDAMFLASFIFPGRPDLNFLFENSFRVLREIVKKDPSLQQHFKDILSKEYNEVISVGFDGEMAANSKRVDKTLIFNKSFINDLLEQQNVGNTAWANSILAHRLMHELGHDPEQSADSVEAAEEAKLIEWDLALLNLYIGEGIQSKLDQTFKTFKEDNKELFSSGYYFNFLKALLGLKEEGGYEANIEWIIEVYASHQNIHVDEIVELTRLINERDFEEKVKKIEKRDISVGHEDGKNFGGATPPAQVSTVGETAKLESGWILANQRFMAFHMVFLSGVGFFLSSLVGTGAITTGEVLKFLVFELGSSVVLAAIARHCILAAHMMGHYLEAKAQGDDGLAEETKEKIEANGIEKGIDESLSARIWWVLNMFALMPYGKYPGVEMSGGWFMPNLYVKTKGYNLAINAKGPAVGRMISIITLSLGVPSLVAGVWYYGMYSVWVEYFIRLILTAGVISGLDINRTDNGAYGKLKAERDAAAQARKGAKADAATSDAQKAGPLLQSLLDDSSRMNSCEIPLDVSGYVPDNLKQIFQPHQFRSILEGRGDGANISMGKFGFVVLGGNERFCGKFVDKVQNRIKVLMQETKGLTHLGLSTSGSERGTLEYGSVDKENISAEKPEDELSDEEAVRLLTQAVRDSGGVLYGEAASENKPQVVMGIAPEADNLADAYETAHKARETGKYQFDYKPGSTLEADSDYLIRFYKRLHKLYGVSLFINPFSEDDVAGYRRFKKEMGDDVIIASSNLMKSNPSKIRALDDQLPDENLNDLVDAILLLPGQIGTLSELIAATVEAEKRGLQVIVGRSSQATIDTLEADFALGMNAAFNDFGGGRNPEVLDKITHMEQVMGFYNNKDASGKPDKNVEDITIVDAKAYSHLTNASVPTMKVIITLSNGYQIEADSPVGQFVKQEDAGDLDVAANIVDGVEREFNGNNCRKAIENFDTIVAPMFVGKSIWDLPDLINAERMLLEKEREMAEDNGLLTKYSNTDIEFGEKSSEVHEGALENRKEIKAVLVRKAALGLQPIAAASIALLRIAAYRDGKQVVQILREQKIEGIDEDYLYGFKEAEEPVAHLQSHWVLANHNFMSFHVAFLTGVVFFLRGLVSKGAIQAGNLAVFMQNVSQVAIIAVIATTIAVGIYSSTSYIRDRENGRLAEEVLSAVTESGIEKGINDKSLAWKAKLAYMIPLGKYPGIKDFGLKKFISLVAVVTFFGMWIFKTLFPAEDLITFFVKELGSSIIIAGIIGHISMGAHEFGHYRKARIMGRLVDEVAQKVKEDSKASRVEQNIFDEKAGEISYKELPILKRWFWGAAWRAYITLTAPLGKFPGVEKSGSLFTPNLSVRTTVQGKDALPIRVEGPYIDRAIFRTSAIPSILLSLLIVLVFQGDYVHLAEYAQYLAQGLIGLSIISKLDIGHTDKGAYGEQKKEDARTKKALAEFSEALSQQEDGAETHAGGDVIENPREYFIKKRSDPKVKGLATYITESGIKEYIIPTEQERNTIQGGLHVDMIKKGEDLLGGYEIVIAIGNLHLQEFMLIPDTGDEGQKAAICSAIQSEVVKVLNKYKGVMLAGAGLEGGLAVNLKYGAISFSEIPGYEWIEDAKYPSVSEDEDRSHYMEEIHEGDSDEVIEKKKQYQLPEEEAWKILLLATINAGYTPGDKKVDESVIAEKPRVWFGMDGAVSSLYYEYNRAHEVKEEDDCTIGYKLYKDPSQRELTREDFIKFYKRIITRYPIACIEDPFGETDREGWKELYDSHLPDGRRIGSVLNIVADDNVTTDEEPIRRGKREKAFNTVLIKLNQIGSVSETARAIVASLEGVICDSVYDILKKVLEQVGALKKGDPTYEPIKSALIELLEKLVLELDEEEQQVYNVIISHRSQSPADDIEAEFANASNAFAAKFGGAYNYERQHKFFRMLLNQDFANRGIQLNEYKPGKENYARAGKELTIISITPQEVFVNSGTPTVRVTVCLSDGSTFTASTPIGTSSGATEAEHLQDFVKDDFSNKGCLKAVENCKKMTEKLIGMSVWDGSLNDIADVDRFLMQQELDELESSGELEGLFVAAIKSAKADGKAMDSAVAVAAIKKQVTITSKKRKKKLGMNSILPTSSSLLRMMAFRDGKYRWELIRQEIYKIMIARMPKYAARNKIRSDIRAYAMELKDELGADSVNVEKSKTEIEGLQKRINDYWDNENNDAHSDYLYGFDDKFNPIRDWAEDSGITRDTAKEFDIHRLTPWMPEDEGPEKGKAPQADAVSDLKPGLVTKGKKGTADKKVVSLSRWKKERGSGLGGAFWGPGDGAGKPVEKAEDYAEKSVLANAAKMIGNMPHREDMGTTQAVNNRLSDAFDDGKALDVTEAVRAFVKDESRAWKEFFAGLSRQKRDSLEKAILKELNFYEIDDSKKGLSALTFQDRNNFQLAHVGYGRKSIYISRGLKRKLFLGDEGDKKLLMVLLAREVEIYKIMREELKGLGENFGYKNATEEEKKRYDAAVEKAENEAESQEKTLLRIKFGEEYANALDEFLQEEADKRIDGAIIDALVADVFEGKSEDVVFVGESIKKLWYTHGNFAKEASNKEKELFNIQKEGDIEYKNVEWMREAFLRKAAEKNPTFFTKAVLVGSAELKVDQDTFNMLVKDYLNIPEARIFFAKVVRQRRSEKFEDKKLKQQVSIQKDEDDFQRMLLFSRFVKLDTKFAAELILSFNSGKDAFIKMLEDFYGEKYKSEKHAGFATYQELYTVLGIASMRDEAFDKGTESFKSILRTQMQKADKAEKLATGDSYRAFKIGKEDNPVEITEEVSRKITDFLNTDNNLRKLKELIPTHGDFFSTLLNRTHFFNIKNTQGDLMFFGRPGPERRFNHQAALIDMGNGKKSIGFSESLFDKFKEDDKSDLIPTLLVRELLRVHAIEVAMATGDWNDDMVIEYMEKVEEALDPEGKLEDYLQSKVDDLMLWQALRSSDIEANNRAGTNLARFREEDEPKALILYADDILDRGVAWDIEKALAQRISDHKKVLTDGKITLYVKKRKKEDKDVQGLKNLIEGADSTITVSVIDKTDLNRRTLNDDYTEMKALKRYAKQQLINEDNGRFDPKQLLGIFRNHNDDLAGFTVIARKLQMPVVGFGIKRGIYSFAEALNTAMLTRNATGRFEWYTMLSPVQALDTEKVRHDFDMYVEQILIKA